MADVTKIDPISVDMVSAQQSFRFVGFPAGEDLDAGDIVYLSSIGRLMKCVSSQVTISGVPNFLGMVNSAVPSGATGTVFGQGARFQYGSRLNEGEFLYVSDTAGLLATPAIANLDDGVVLCLTDEDILIVGLPT